MEDINSVKIMVISFVTKIKGENSFNIASCKSIEHSLTVYQEFLCHEQYDNVCELCDKETIVLSIKQHLLTILSF